jgi:multimeric flavodoxin WrbA
MSDVNVLVTYYSATGSVHRMAQAAVVGAEKAGGVVRLRKVRELAPQEAIASNKGGRGTPSRPRPCGRRRWRTSSGRTSCSSGRPRGSA